MFAVAPDIGNSMITFEALDRRHGCDIVERTQICDLERARDRSVSVTGMKFEQSELVVLQGNVFMGQSANQRLGESLKCKMLDVV